ncbi:hypothetical protein [Legionella sp. CNM-4043-24]|uniref:hypothetical protein n=1 Tax=Legionella sp. CNM-4043-24 TaxID=3421646 RepID=UPI00403ABA6E
MIKDIKSQVQQDAVRDIFSEITAEGFLKKYMGAYGFLTISSISPAISLDELAIQISQNNFDSVVEAEEAPSGAMYGISRSRCCLAFFAAPESGLAQVEYNKQISLNMPGSGQYSFQLHFIGIFGCTKERAYELYIDDPFLFAPAARLSERSDCAIM